MLRFVRSYEAFSTYRNDSGEIVCLEHGHLFGWVERLSPFTTEWDRDLFRAIAGDTPYPVVKEIFAATVTGLWAPTEIHKCDDCSEVDTDVSTVGNKTVCQECIDEGYSWCERCETYADCDGMTWVGERSLCVDCVDLHTSWCDHCGERYFDDDSEYHHHGGCDCEAPGQVFTVRNDGEDPLSNDERVTVRLPAGVITDEGIAAIRAYLANAGEYEARRVVWNLDPRWQTKEGNFTKRLSRTLYKHDGSKLSADVMSQIGNIAREHSTPVEHRIEVTRDLNQSPEMFAHEESCWWQSYSESRCALKTNGGFGLRSFNDGDTAYPSGRAWVMPLKRDGEHLTPTFETLGPDAFVVFNGYGDLSGYTAARIVAHMAGMTYRKVTFTCNPMYVNGDSGYLIAPEEIASDYTDGSLSLTVDQHSTLHQTETTEKEMAHA